MPTTSKANQKAVNKYIKGNYDRVNLTLPKGYKQIVQEASSAVSESVNAYIKTAIDERMERDRRLGV